MVRTVSAALALLLLLGAGQARGQSGLPPGLRGVGFDQRLNEQVPLDLEFKDETGQTVRFGDLFGGKPVILVPAYFRCPKLCGEVQNGLVRALLDITLDVGKDFKVIVLSFDPRETPEMARAKRETYLQRYGRPGTGAGWHFLTGREDAIKRLTAAVGFRYRYDAKHDQYAHAAGIVVLTPTGKVFRYFRDIRYKPRDLRLGLVEASQGRIGTLLDQALLFFCFHYDPEEGRYGPAVMKLVRLGGVLTLLGIGLFVAILWRKGRRAASSSTPLSSVGEGQG
jgi:protein SCO1/2